MSSAGNSTAPSVAATAETDKMFFCYQCNQTITISISSTADPFCPLCNLGFLEEYPDPNPNLIFPISDPASSRLPFIPVMDFTNLDHSNGINVQMLFDNEPQGGHHHHHHNHRYGTHPAWKSAVEGLPTVKVTDSEMSQCAVCLDEFEGGVGVKEMPCGHVYHCDCLIPWLQLRNRWTRVPSRLFDLVYRFGGRL